MKLSWRLAKDNIRAQRRLYLPFLLSAVGIIALSYIVASLANNESLLNTYAGSYVSAFLEIGVFVIYLFALIFLFYSNSFIAKQRESELGLYNVLGMSKGNIVRVLLAETTIIYFLAIILGTIVGIVFEKLAFLIILRAIGVEVIFGFSITPNVILMTISYFGLVYGLLFLYSSYRVIKSDPIRFLQEKEAGEKEPKASWLIALLGVIFMVGGYLLANILIENALYVLIIFFPAVFAVIIGTYLLFTSGSIALLTFLKRRKSYYYKTSHFITVSHLIFRMKKNAAGLASICIMAAMILVMMSSTTSMWFSLEENTNKSYPLEYLIKITETNTDDEVIGSIVDETLAQYDNASTNFIGFKEVELWVDIEDTEIIIGDSYYLEATGLIIIDSDTFELLTGEHIELKTNEVILYDENGIYDYDLITISGIDYEIVDTVNENIDMLPDQTDLNGAGEFVLIVDTEVFETFSDAAVEIYMFDLLEANDGYNIVYSVFSSIIEVYPSANISIVDKQAYNAELKAMYAAFLFLGIFLGLTFLVSIILIMYYKQVSEGDEDYERYVIMQKVGLSDKEIRKTIRTQMVFVFFAPLVVAMIHLLGSFKMVSFILATLTMLTSDVYLYTCLISTAVFIVFYVIVYFLTSRTYYRMITRRH